MKLKILSSTFGALAIAALLLPPQASDSNQPMSMSVLEILEFHLPAIIPPALAQAQQSLLIDRHTAAGLVCSTCHGAAAFNEPVAEATCTQCHGNYAALAAKTPWEPNPHHSHMGELACSTCHNIHKPSVSFCDQCHSFGMQVP